jgi:alpha-L-rhamnosidase
MRIACVLAVAAAAAAASELPLTPVGLDRVVGSPATGPIFISWRLQGGGAGSTQAGFQLRIRDSAGVIVLDEVHNNTAPRAVVDVTSIDAPAAEVGALRAGGEYGVRVRDAASGVWSQWATAPFHWGPGAAREDWTGAEWICTSPGSTDGRTSMLRGSFNLPPAPAVVSAALVIAGLGQFSATLNGARMSAATNEPGWTDFTSRVLYSVIDVTRLVVPGKNALGCLLGNGFYNVPAPPDGRYTKFTAPPYGPRAVIAQLTILLSDGSTTTVNSVPGEWNASDGGAVVFTHQ